MYSLYYVWYLYVNYIDIAACLHIICLNVIPNWLLSTFLFIILTSACFFSERVISKWKELPDWAVNSATVTEFKSSLSKCLGSCLYDFLDWNLRQGQGSDIQLWPFFTHTLVTRHGIEMLHSSFEIHWSIFLPINVQTHYSNSIASTSPLKLPPAASWSISFLQGFPPLLAHLRDRETKQVS